MPPKKNSANSIFGGTAGIAAKKASRKEKIDAVASGSGCQLNAVNSQRLLMGKSVVGTVSPIICADNISQEEDDASDTSLDASLDDTGAQEKRPRFGEHEVSNYCTHSLQTLS
jgi:hypothetical protein